MQYTLLIRSLQLVFMNTIVFYCFGLVAGEKSTEEYVKVPVGVVFEQHAAEVQHAFKRAITQANESQLDFEAYVDIINTADVFKLSRLTCKQLDRGAIAMLGAVSPDSFATIHAYLNTFQMPFVTPWFPEKMLPPDSSLTDYALSMRPDYHQAVIDVINYYNWHIIIYIYDSEEGLLRLQQLYQRVVPGKTEFRYARRVSSAVDAFNFLKLIDSVERGHKKNVILDSSAALARHLITLHVRDVSLGRRNYHYFLTGLVMDDHWYKNVPEFYALTITAFELVDYSRKFVKNFLNDWINDTISAKAALTYDAMKVVMDAAIHVHRNEPDLLKDVIRTENVTAKEISNLNRTKNRTQTECSPKGMIEPYKHGDIIIRYIKMTELEGLSGLVRFDWTGRRRGFALNVVETSGPDSLVKVAVWYDRRGIVPLRRKLAPLNMDDSGSYNRNKTYIVLTIEEQPYLTSDPPDALEATSELYRGFCADLANVLADKLEIKHEFRLVKDGKYGDETRNTIEGWNGLVGDLVREDVDMVIAPLLITKERAAVIDFSIPFLYFNLISESQPTKSNIFSFIQPFSTEIWVCILVSLFAVGIVIFLVSRFSPQEWLIVSVPRTRPSDPTNPAPTLTVLNRFSFWNSMWFSVGSFLQQGGNSPRSLSGRIATCAWWFFGLMVICTYTANLASSLTFSKMTKSIANSKRITECPEDIMNKEVRRHEIHGNDEEVTAFLRKKRSTDSKTLCEVVSSGGGFMKFAVGVPKGSKLRDGVNQALQSLKDEGELEMLLRKWFVQEHWDLPPPKVGGLELTLHDMDGLFYILLIGLAVALVVALIEFIRHGHNAAHQANMSLRSACCARSQLDNVERVSVAREQQDAFNERPFSGQYFSPGHEDLLSQEDEEMQTSFSQV